MGKLRDRMEEDLKLRNVSPATRSPRRTSPYRSPSATPTSARTAD
jgi:hypothetical protein